MKFCDSQNPVLGSQLGERRRIRVSALNSRGNPGVYPRGGNPHAFSRRLLPSETRPRPKGNRAFGVNVGELAQMVIWCDKSRFTARLHRFATRRHRSATRLPKQPRITDIHCVSQLTGKGLTRPKERGITFGRAKSRLAVRRHCARAQAPGFSTRTGLRRVAAHLV